MKKLGLLIFVCFLVSCDWTDGGSNETYVSTVRNESGVAIKVIGYYYSYKREQVTYLENQQEITKKYKSSLGTIFDLSYFFTTTAENGVVRSRRLTDSIKVIYDEKKYKIFNDSNRDDERNPIGWIVSAEGDYFNKTFTFTEEDYNDAIDCDENCE